MSFTPALRSVEEACRLLEEACPRWGDETLPLGQARGRVLAETIHAREDWPPFPRVMMDGVALDSRSPRGLEAWLPVQGVQGAGDPPMALLERDSVIEVMTGAMLPLGCDCVVPVEDLDQRPGAVRLRERACLSAGRHVHLRGNDAPAGALLLPAGSVLHSAALAVAAAAGAHQIVAKRRPQVVVVATGKELVPVEQAPLPWQIRASNGVALTAALEASGIPVLRQDCLGDEVEPLRQALRQAMDEAEVLVLSGGISKGRFDHVPAILKELGCRELFHGVAQRPGKPLLAALHSGRWPTLVLALPGNPVSALCALHRYLLPLLRRRLGLPAREAPALVAAGHARHERFTLFLPARLEVAADGRRHAIPVPTANSGDFLPLADTQGFVEIAPGPPVPEGSVAPFHPWS